jgi:hypothetical protein
MEEEIRTGPARKGLYLILGGILAVLGLIGVGIYAFTPRNTPAEGDAQADAAWQSGIIIGSGIALGVGVLLLLLALVASMRARRTR